MVRCKNASGGSSDGDESPPRVIEVARGKRKKIAIKKRKRTPTKAEIAQAVADAAECAERGGESSGIHIGERRFILKVDSSVLRPQRGQRTHLQSSPQRTQRR
jgi:hypothetical protein